MLEGGGTLTTGGIVEAGKFVGGESHPIKAGDVVYLPAGLPHGVSGVNGNITWLNVRWDTDWPNDAPLGAGNFQGRGRGPPPPGPDSRLRRLRRPPLRVMPNEHAPGRSVGGGKIFIPKERLDGYLKDMELKNVGTLRMIEGGRFNVNIRHIKAQAPEFHDITVDTWVVLKGGGTAVTGFELRTAARRGHGRVDSRPRSAT